MNRRALLSGISALAASAVAGPALAKFPHGAAATSGGGPTTSLTLATFVNSGMAGTPSQIVLGYTGAAPTSLTALWSGSGGAATFTSVQTDGPFVKAYVTLPAAGTYTLNAITGGGASAGNTGSIVSSAIVTDFAAGIYGPSTVTQGQDAFGGNLSQGVGSWFVRGMTGAVSWSISDTVSGSGDSSFFSIGLSTNPVWAFACDGTLLPNGQNTSQTSFAVTVTATDAVGATLSMAVTVLNPATPTVTISNNTVADSATVNNQFGNVTVAAATAFGGSATFSASPNIITYDPGDGWLLITAANLAANIGTTVTCTMQASGGPVQTFPIRLVHETVRLSWKPMGTIYSSTPATSGYGGIQQSGTNCNQIGTLMGSAETGYFRNAMTSNPSGALNIYSLDPIFSVTTNVPYGRTGNAYLLSSVSAGTLSGTCQSSSFYGRTNNMVFTLPVAAGTTAPASDITATPVTGLTNFSFPTALTYPGIPTPSITFTNGQIVGNTLTFTASSGTPTVGMLCYGTPQVSAFGGPTAIIITGGSGLSWTVSNPSNISTTAGGVTSATMPTTVANISCTFAPNWALSHIDVFLSNGNAGNCQLFKGPSNLATTLRYNPRYAIYPTGANTSIVTAWNCPAIDHTGPQVDTVAITLTDGNGTFCRQTFANSVAWHTYTGAALTVGPGGTFATFSDLNAAANGAPATYAGASVVALAGVDNSWNRGNYSGSSYNGWLFCPLHIVGDSSTQATFTGTITSVSGSGLTTTGTLTFPSNTGTINLNDFILISGTTARMIITAGSGLSWTVVGPGVATMSSVAMTTQHQQIPIDFTGQGNGFTRGGGFDLDIEGIEIYNVPSGGQAAGMYIFNNNVGNVTLRDCYIHDCGNGIFNADYSVRVQMINCLFAACGAGGSFHNIYIDNAEYVKMSGTNSWDSLVHECKLRAQNADIDNCVIGEGVNWFGAGSPFQQPQGGIYNITNTVFVKGTNGGNAGNGNVIEPYNECVGPQPAHEMWYVNQFNVNNCTVINLYGAGAPVNGIVQVQGNVPVTLDPVRGLPVNYNLTNIGFYNLASGNWSQGTGLTSYPAAAPPIGAGCVALTAFPFTGIALINPLTGCAPTRTPRPAPQGQGGIRSSPGASNTLVPYNMILTVPTAAGSGANVAGGLIAAYDESDVQMTATTFTIIALGSDFTVTNSSPTAQIKTAASLADGFLALQASVSGTGTILRNTAFLPVIVGAG